MSHELRTPLNAIIGFGSMLRDEDAFPVSVEARKNYIGYILQSADLLLGHINTILEVAALESGKLDLEEDMLDVGLTVENAITRAAIRLEAANAKVQIADIGADIFAWADEVRVGQAIDQALHVAIKFYEPGDPIKVSFATDEKGWVQIIITHKGKGLNAEDLENALSALEQLQRGLDQSFSGPGVSYAVAKTFIEMQGGIFSIVTAPEKGATVTMSLPPSEKARNAGYGLSQELYRGRTDAAA